MSDCLLALHDCSLIGLEESPDLLRQSLFCHQRPGSVLLWDTQAQQVNVTRRLAFTPAAAGPPTCVKNLQQAVAACELSLVARAGSSVLECSLPVYSESPAIVGKQLPRSRFRRRADAAACHPCGQQSAQQQPCFDAAVAPAKVDDRLESSDASSCCLLDCNSCGGAATTACDATANSERQGRAQGAEHLAEKADPTVGAADGSHSPAANGKANNELLQALLDDSSASAASLLQPAISRMNSTDPGWVAEEAIETKGQYGSYYIIDSSLRTSADSNVSEFQGFWHPATAIRSPFSTPHAGRNPASSLLLLSASLTHAPSGLVSGSAAVHGRSACPEGKIMAETPVSRRVLDSLECLSSCDTWLPTEARTEAASDHEGEDAPGSPIAAADTAEADVEQPQQQQAAWNELLLLLSLDESVSLMQATTGTGLHSSIGEQQTQGVSQDAHLSGPDNAEATRSAVPRPDSPCLVAGTAGLLPSAVGCKTWVSPDVAHGRYSNCCPSPTSPGLPGSPSVLMSSPVLDACGDANASKVHASTKSRSVVCGQPSSHAPAAGEAHDLLTSPPQHCMLQQDTTADEEQQQRPNAIQFSPIRGVTLCSRSMDCMELNGSADSLDDTSAGTPQQQPGDLSAQQECVQFPSPAGCNRDSSPQWHLRPQQAVSGGNNALLLQLLDDSSDSWAGVLNSEQPGNMQTPSAAATQDFPQPELSVPQMKAAAGADTADDSSGTAGLRLKVPEHPSSFLSSAAASPTLSIADSVDSFVFAAAGQPYSSISMSPKNRKGSFSILGHVKAMLPEQHLGQMSRSQQWCAYQGLGDMLTPSGAQTPASVICKNGWDQHAALQPDAAQQIRSAASETPQPFNAAAKGSASQQCTTNNPLCDAMDSEVQNVPHQNTLGSAASHVAQDAAVVQNLADKLAAAELQCAKQQQEVMQARQLALEKELQLQLLKNALHSSEVEGSNCLDALAAAMDLVSATQASSSVASSMELDVSTLSSPSGNSPAAHAASDPNGGSSLQLLQQEVEQLQEHNGILQQHNSEMQSTLAEAGQQLDLLETRVAVLSAEKEAAEGRLTEMNKHFQRQLQEQQQFTQSELDEQQQQHEEEVRQLHDRLEDLSTQLQQAQHELEGKRNKLQLVESELGSCMEELERTRQQLEELQQAMDGRASESAASTEQLHRQVQQLLAAKRELQEANARLVDAEAEYASNQLTLGCRNKELLAQLESAQAANKQLEDTIKKLQAQNDSLSQMCRTLKASAAGQAAACDADRPANGANSNIGNAGLQVQPDAGPTPMRRRMAAVTAQLERRCQQLLEEKQQLALQVQQLQQQQPQADAADTVEQHQALLQELQDQVEHLSTCNDELLVQLQDLQSEHEQLFEERNQLLDQLTQKEQDLASTQCKLADTVAEQQNQQQELLRAVEANTMLSRQCEELQQGSVASKGLLVAGQQRSQLLQQQLQEAKAAAAAADAQRQQLQAQLAGLQQQLDEAKQRQQERAHQQSCEQQLRLKNTAMFERCQELERRLQDLQGELQAQQRGYEQRLAAAAVTAAAAAPASKSDSSKADQQHKHLIAELRAKLRDVLALLEEKQQLVEVQAKQHAEQQHDWSQQRDRLEHELQQVQKQLSSLQAQHDQQLTHCDALQLQLKSDRLAKEAAERGIAAANQSNSELEEALLKMQNQNQALIDQVVRLQLVDPADDDAHAGTKHHKLCTGDAAVQVDIGATPEQAAAVQQLLLLQAQQQLQDMELQNKKAAEKLLESKAKMKELQASMQQQEQQLKLREQELHQTRQLHQKQTDILHAENDQLAQQLAEARKQLHTLQAAYKQLEVRVLQQQEDLEKQQQMLAEKQQELLKQQSKVQQQQLALEEQTTALDTSQQLVQSLQQQQTLDKLQVATAAAELQKAREHAQQLLQAKDQETQAVLALQQQVQQLLQEGRQQEQVAASNETATAAARAREAAVREELCKSKQQVQQLLQEKDTLVVELQQTKVAVDFLEDSVRRLGHHNSTLSQQMKDTLAAAAATATAAEQAKAGSILELQAGSEDMAGAAPVSPRTLQQIITAATKVNEKNKRLKKRLQAMQGVNGGC